MIELVNGGEDTGMSGFVKPTTTDSSSVVAVHLRRGGVSFARVVFSPEATGKIGAFACTAFGGVQAG